MNFGGSEMLLIAVVVFLLFGATRLPQLAKAFGQSKKAFKEGLREAEGEELAQKSEFAGTKADATARTLKRRGDHV
jgi:sec-independent protein translocase protein TatA